MHDEARLAPQTDTEKSAQHQSMGTGTTSTAAGPLNPTPGGQASIDAGNPHPTKIRRRTRHKRQKKSQKFADLVWKLLMILLALVVVAGIIVIVRAVIQTEFRSLSQSAS
jgi:hypothetical protein